MTREEALKQIEELKKFIEDCDRKVGFEDDELFLLSAEEYEHYEDKIPLYQKIPERMGGGEKMTKDKYSCSTCTRRQCVN